MDLRRVGLFSLTALLVVSLTPAAWAGGKLQMETIAIAETFEDEELSDVCGVDVMTAVEGHITFLAFPDRPTGPQQLSTIHLTFVARALDSAVRFKDVGVDMVRVLPDGTAILMVVGQVPFEFAGVLKTNLDTGEVILEPRHVVDMTRACRLLTK